MVLTYIKQEKVKREEDTEGEDDEAEAEDNARAGV